MWYLNIIVIINYSYYILYYYYSELVLLIIIIIIIVIHVRIVQLSVDVQLLSVDSNKTNCVLSHLATRRKTMATHGSLSAFDSSKEDWSSCILRLKYYFEANEVTDSNKKKSILLSACGPATFRRIGSLLTTARLESIGYEDLIAVVKNFYDPKPSIIVQRFQFNTRVRAIASSESIATYIAALRNLAEHCSYGDKMLRDRLVCGVNHDTIQSRLLAEKDLTYEKSY